MCEVENSLKKHKELVPGTEERQPNQTVKLNSLHSPHHKYLIEHVIKAIKSETELSKQTSQDDA